MQLTISIFIKQLRYRHRHIDTYRHSHVSTSHILTQTGKNNFSEILFTTGNRVLQNGVAEVEWLLHFAKKELLFLSCLLASQAWLPIILFFHPQPHTKMYGLLIFASPAWSVRYFGPREKKVQRFCPTIPRGGVSNNKDPGYTSFGPSSVNFRSNGWFGRVKSVWVCWLKSSISKPTFENVPFIFCLKKIRILKAKLNG